LVDSTTNGSEFVIGSNAPPLGVKTLLSARDPVYSSLSQSSGDGKSSPHFSISKQNKPYNYNFLPSTAASAAVNLFYL
jgi:hypothetical protein